MRIVLESFGASVSWDNAINSVVVNKNIDTNEVKTAKYTAEEIYRKYSSSVFMIRTYDSIGNSLGSGSGFFINTKGTAITNYHVIKGATSAKIMTSDGSIFDVEGVYDYDEILDIAKIKINGMYLSTKKGSSYPVEKGSTFY